MKNFEIYELLHLAESDTSLREEAMAELKRRDSTYIKCSDCSIVIQEKYCCLKK